MPLIKCIPQVWPTAQSLENVPRTASFTLLGMCSFGSCSCFLGGRHVGSCDPNPWLTSICWVLIAIEFPPTCCVCLAPRFLPVAVPLEPLGFHSFAVRRKHIVHSSPRSSWYSLKLSPKGNALLFVDACSLSAGTCELRAYLMVQAGPLVSEVPKSLYTVTSASKRLPFVPRWL